jgi:hypothetical protein
LFTLPAARWRLSRGRTAKARRARTEPCPSVGDHGVPLDPSLSIKALAALAAVVLLERFAG